MRVMAFRKRLIFYGKKDENMDKIKVGVIGLARGMSFTRDAELSGLELVAICDKWEERLREAPSSVQ